MTGTDPSASKRAAIAARAADIEENGVSHFAAETVPADEVAQTVEGLREARAARRH